MSGFYLSMGNYYQVPEREIIIIRDRGIPHYDILVVLFIARRAHVPPAVIIDLRLSGRSWNDITLHFGLSPEIYYVPVRIVPGPPYGRAYGYYRNKPKKEWRKIVLSDDDVVNLINLKFISEYHGYGTEDIIRMRSAGKDFVVIHDDIRKAREEKAAGMEEHRKRKDQASQKGVVIKINEHYSVLTLAEK